LHAGRLHKIDFLRSSPIIIDEILMLFRRSFPELTGCATRRALSLLGCLNFRYLNYIPTHLRFFARALPIACVEKTNLFSRDEEIIRLIMSTAHDVSGLLIKNLDFNYIANTLLPSLLMIDGAWGVLMRMTDRHLVFHPIGTTMRLKLLEFLLQVVFQTSFGNVVLVSLLIALMLR